MPTSSPSNAEADLETRARQVFGAVFGIEPAALHDDSSPDTIAKWDSQGHLNLMLALEQEFGVQFSEEQMYEMLNFRLVVLTLQELADPAA